MIISGLGSQERNEQSLFTTHAARMQSNGNIHPLMMGIQTFTGLCKAVWQFLGNPGIDLCIDPAILPVLILVSIVVIKDHEEKAGR